MHIQLLPHEVVHNLCAYAMPTPKKIEDKLFSQQQLKTFVINWRSNIDMEKKKENNVREGPLLYQSYKFFDNTFKKSYVKTNKRVVVNKMFERMCSLMNQKKINFMFCLRVKFF
jgi:hypothetical protein